jgi:hypothetical protein
MDTACSTYGGRRGAYRVLMGKPEGRRPDPGIDRRIIFKWIFVKWDGGGGHGLDQSASR